MNEIDLIVLSDGKLRNKIFYGDELIVEIKIGEKVRNGITNDEMRRIISEMAATMINELSKTEAAKK